ncbi:MAG: hypothetical protein K2W33_15655, partial [Burkholderiales bacterium]|nr:hypothetical protein [Burkholderiales bacterium]
LDPATALPPPVSQADAHSLAGHLRTQTGFAMAPTWQGACAHTGSWTRLGAPPPVAALTPWGLLGSRLAELARLCLHDPASQSGPGALSFGAMPVGDGQGLAWVEMARGLLVHWVSLQVSQGGTVVHACHVMAPTEWNFHPHGAVARYIARLDASQPADGVACKVRMLMAAFDPCVPFEVQRPHPLTEMSYA